MGASNLRHGLQHFAASYMDFEEIKVLGWTASAENVANMTAEVGKKSKKSAAFVFNILSNGSVRNAARDLKKLVENVVPVFKAQGTKPCVIVKPMPRYLFCIAAMAIAIAVM